MKKRRPVPVRTYAVNPFPKKEALLFLHPIRQSLKHTVIHQLYVIADEMTSVFICIILYFIRIFMNFPPFKKERHLPSSRDADGQKIYVFHAVF